MGDLRRKISNRILLAVLIGTIIIPTIAYAYYQFILSDSYTLTVLVVDEEGKAVADATVQVLITTPKGPVKLVEQLKTNNRGKAKFRFSIKNLTNPWIETNQWLAEHGGIANPGILMFAYHINGEKIGTATHTITIPWEIRGKGPISIEKTLKLKWNTSVSKAKVKVVVNKAEFTPKEQAPALKYELAWSKEKNGYVNLVYLKTDKHSQGVVTYVIPRNNNLAYKITINEGMRGWELVSGEFGSTTWLEKGDICIGVGYDSEAWVSIVGRVIWETWYLRYYYDDLPGPIVRTDYKTYIKYVIPDTLGNVRGDYYDVEASYKYYKSFMGKGVDVENRVGTVCFDDFTANTQERVVPLPYNLAAELIEEGLGDLLPGVALGIEIKSYPPDIVLFGIWSDVDYIVEVYYRYADRYSVPMAWVKYETYQANRSLSYFCILD